MLHVADYPVGLEYQVSVVTSLIDVGSNDEVHTVGIHGIGGIGKTTLAIALYNLVADHFEGTCFLESVRENSNKKGLVHLQNIIISELLGEKKIKVTGVKQGNSIIQHRLQKKKVLLILDDVDKQEQLQAIVGQPNWFGAGSRVIITTRDKQLLACHGVERTYELEGLNYAQALELISWKAFKTDIVCPSYTDVLNRAITYASGLPLALEVIGSSLYGKNVKDWESAFNLYENIPHDRIHAKLKVSFDALKKNEQSVFLDIACCFKGYQKAMVDDILHAHYGGCMKYPIGVLADKSLIKISWDGIVTLHDMIEDMGKEIVRQKSLEEPGKRSRLWFHEDIIQVLKGNQGTTEIEILHLDFPLSEEGKEVEWDAESFEKMKNLKTLIIRNGHFLEGPKHLPNSLRVLEWWGYPSGCLPYNFDPKNLSIFKLPNNFSASFDLASFLLKKFVKLKVLNFDYNVYLTEITDVSGLPNLEKFSFQHCEKLTTIHDSIGFLDKLKILSALGCYKLRSFPPIKLPYLETLELSYCTRLENFPEILGKMENITELYLELTCIKELPLSFRNLTQLRHFTICNCLNMTIGTIACDWDGSLTSKEYEGDETVSSIVSSNVEHLCLSWCNLSDDFFPMDLALFGNVKELNLSSNNFTILPACIKECRFLRKLVVDGCFHLREISWIPPNLEHFSAIDCKSLTSSCTSMLLNQVLHEAGNTMFILPGIMVPECFEHRNKGGSISFWFRNKFPALALCFAFGQNLLETSIRPIVIINGNEHFFDLVHGQNFFITDHIYVFYLQKTKFKDNVDEALLENEWNHVEVSHKTKHVLLDFIQIPAIQTLKEVGIHVFKQKSTTEDIRFTNPHNRRKLDDGLSSPES